MRALVQMVGAAIVGLLAIFGAMVIIIWLASLAERLFK